MEDLETVQEVIELLAEKLGPLATTVWEAYVKQAMLMGAMQTALLILSLLMILGCVIGLLKCITHQRKRTEQGLRKSDNVTAEEIVGMGCIGVAIVSAFVAWANLQGPIHMLNPLFYAIQLLLGRPS